MMPTPDGMGCGDVSADFSSALRITSAAELDNSLSAARLISTRATGSRNGVGAMLPSGKTAGWGLVNNSVALLPLINTCAFAA
jgi:hypothetical protein